MKVRAVVLRPSLEEHPDDDSEEPRELWHDGTSQTLVHRNVKSTPEAFRETVAPYRDDLVVAAECMFT